MKRMIIGQSGAGKSTLARKMQTITHSPLLPLNLLWHTTDYSDEAAEWFKAEQKKFMAENESWIIEGNYTGTATERIEEADQIILLKVPTLLAIYRVILRSIKRKRNKATRPDMPHTFSEKLDSEYIEFLSFVLHYKKKNEPRLLNRIDQLGASKKLIILHNKREQTVFLKKLSK